MLTCELQWGGLPDGGRDQRSGNWGNDTMTNTANQVIVAAIVASKEALHAHKVSSVAALAH